MDSQYKGPKTTESYLMKKRNKSRGNEEKTVLRYFKFNLTEKSLVYKDDQDTKEIKMIYTGKDLVLFVDTVDNEDKYICEYEFGFQIITSVKTFVLFAPSKEVHSKWIRILNFHFNKIDILNPMAFLGSQSQTASIQDKPKINQNNIKYFFL